MDIEKIIEHNLSKLRKPADFNTKIAQVDYHTVNITYNTETGEICTRPVQHAKGEFSEIVLSWKDNGTYGFRPYNNESNAVHRLSDDGHITETEEFGTKRGDKVLEESITLYNAFREFAIKHKKKYDLSMSIIPPLWKMLGNGGNSTKSKNLEPEGNGPDEFPPGSGIGPGDNKYPF